jgi:hypothetical protein
MESKANKKGGDKNLALFGKTNKSKSKRPSKGKGVSLTAKKEGLK